MKKKFSRFLSWMLVAAMIAGMIPASVFAETSEVISSETDETNVLPPNEENDSDSIGDDEEIGSFVASLNGQDYETLQEAIDAAVDGGEIVLLSEVTEDVTITQTEGISFTINGDGNTFNGIMTVFGKARMNEAESLTIKNVVFQAAEGEESCIVSPDRAVNNSYSYSHNVTVEGCTFKGNETTPQKAAAIRHEDGGDKNWTITNCTVDANMHSLLQVNNVVGKLTVANCEVYSKNGMNLNSCTNVEITGCTVDVQGYAVRAGVSSGGNLGEAKTFVLENNTLKSACDDKDAVIMLRASAVDMNLNMTKNVVSGETHISGTTAATTVSADANYWDGNKAPVVNGTAVTVNTYYKDAELTSLGSTNLTGSGTEENPYKIATKDDMFILAEKVNDGTYKNVYVELTANIDLEQDDWTSIGTSAHPFTGTFDGKGFSISNIWSYERGLFGYTSTGNYVDSGKDGRATIKNLTLNGVEVYNQSTSAVGGLIGQAGQNTEVSGVKVTGYISIYGYGYVGGLVGQGYVHVDNCEVVGVNNADGDVSTIDASYWAVGGIVGHAGSEGGASITNCSVKNVIIHSAIYGAGAIAGVGTSGPIENVTAESVSVVANSSPDANGALVGCNYKEITGESYAKDVTVTVAGTVVTDIQDMVASVGDVNYGDLQAAVNAGGEVTLLRDVTITNTLTVEAGATVKLNLNGYTITGAPVEAKAYAVIDNKGILTIAGEGSVVCDHKLAGSTAYAVNTVLNRGTLTVEGGIIENKSTASNQIGYAIDNNSTTADAIVVIKGGEVKASGSNYYDGIRQFCNSESKANSVTVEGGKVSSIWLQNPSDGTNRNTKDMKGSIAISGGEVANLYLEPSANFEAAITGGTVGSVSYFEQAEGRDLTGFISGGTFGAASEELAKKFCAKDFAPVLNADGKYNVKEISYVAQIGETKYESFTDALKALKADDTLVLLDDVTITDAWDCRYTGAKITVPVTIDGNEKTIKFTNVVDDKNYFTAFRFEAAVTVKKLTIDMSEAVAVNNRLRAISTKADLTVDNCTFIGSETYTNTRAIIFGEGSGAAIGDVDVTVTNSTFINWKRGLGDNENGQDAKSVTVTGNNFTNADVSVSAAETVTFTGNVMDNSWVNITSYSAENKLSVVAKDNTLEENGTKYNYVDAKEADLQEGFTTPVAEVNGKVYVTLQSAIEAAAKGAAVNLLADVTLTGGYEDEEEGLRIEKGITINGNGYTIDCGNFRKGIRIYKVSGSNMACKFNNVNIVNNMPGGRCIDTRTGKIALTLSKVTLTAEGTNSQPLTLGGDQTFYKVSLNGTKINAGASGYGIISFKDMDANGTLTIAGGSEITGYAALYVKGNNAKIAVNNSTLIGNNTYAGTTNNFGAVVLEGNNNTVNMQFKAAAVTANAQNDATQAAFMLTGTGNNIKLITLPKVHANGNKAVLVAGSKEGLETATIIDNGYGSFAAAGYTTVTDAEGNTCVTVKPVATVNGLAYTSLAEAMRCANAGDTIVLVSDVTGPGLVIDKDITIDFGGYTYTVNKAVGSAGTETLGFQLLNGHEVTLKNGKIAATTVVEGKPVKMLVQNYTNLTLADITLDGADREEIQYVLSNNSGNVVLTGNTNIVAPEGAVAFDVYDYSSAGYTVPSVTVNTTGKITGKIEVSETADIKIFSGTYTEYVENWCADGYVPVKQADGTFVVEEGEFVVLNTNTGIGYKSLADAVKDAGKEETTIKLVTDELKISHIMVGHQFVQNITIDLNGGKLYATDKTMTSYRKGTVLTFVNGTVSGNSTGGTLVASYGGKLVLGKDVTVTCGSQANAIKVADGQLVIDSNVTVTAGAKNWLVVDGKETNVVKISEGTFTGGISIGTGAVCEISGGLFTVQIDQEWCAEYYGPVDLGEEAGALRYTVEDKRVAVIGDIGYFSLSEAIEAAKDGDTIVVTKDITVNADAAVLLDEEYTTFFKVSGKTIAIDLNGRKITGNADGIDMLVGIFSTEDGGHLTLNDSKGIAEVTVHNTEENMANTLIMNYDNTSSITINGGNYYLDYSDNALVDTRCVTVFRDENGEESDNVTEGTLVRGLVVNGGTFRLGNLGTLRNGSPWIFNAKGQNTAHVVVKGGAFQSDIQHQYYPFEVLMPKEKALVQDETLGLYVVTDAAAYVTEREWSSNWYTNKIGYATIAEALEAAEGPKTKVYYKKEYVSEQEDVYVIADSKEDVVIPADFTGTIYLEGCTLKSIIAENKVNIVVNGNVVIENTDGSAITGVELNISGTGTLTAIANGNHAYGIGGDQTQVINLKDLTIADVRGGYVQPLFINDTSYGKSEPEGGAAIGSGYCGAVICLDNVTVKNAQGGSKAAGIGARYHTGVTINITNSVIENVEGGNASAGIGGSRVSDNIAPADQHVVINIVNSTINAVGGQFAAGVGSGYDTHCGKNITETICTINIDENSDITAQGGKYGAGIGTGYHVAALAGNIACEVRATAGESREKYTEAQAVGFGVVDHSREVSYLTTAPSITYMGTVIGVPSAK